jgi:hypothetical protein
MVIWESSGAKAPAEPQLDPIQKMLAGRTPAKKPLIEEL